MATLVLQSVGAAVGGALGGPIGAIVGSSLGALGGAYVDRQIFAPDDQTQIGPRHESTHGGSSKGRKGFMRALCALPHAEALSATEIHILLIDLLGLE